MRATAWQILVVTAFISLDARAADIELTFTPTYWITEKWALSIDMQGHSFLDVTFQLPAVDPARHEIVSAEIEVFSGAAAGHYCLPIICLLDSGGIVLTVDWTGPLPHSASKDTGWIRPAIGKSAGLLAYSDGPFSLDPNALYSGPVEFGARATASYYAGVAGDAGAFVWTGHFFEATYRLNCLQQPCTFDPNVAPSPEPSADFGNWDPNITSTRTTLRSSRLS